MVTLYFTQYFTKGFLKGLTYNDSMEFVDCEAAKQWTKRVARNKRINYVITDRSFQCYFR